MKSFLIGAALMLVGTGLAQASCDIHKVTISGSVARGGAPVADARLTIDFHERQAGDVTVLGQSDADGNFSVEVDYSAYSGKSVLGKERCDFELDELAVSAVKSGSGKATATVRLKDGRQDGELRLNLK